MEKILSKKAFNRAPRHMIRDLDVISASLALSFDLHTHGNTQMTIESRSFVGQQNVPCSGKGAYGTLRRLYQQSNSPGKISQKISPAFLKEVTALVVAQDTPLPE